MLTILHGDALAQLRTIPDRSVQCCCTSPPYWGLRNYGTNPLIWGGSPTCDHVWGDHGKSREKFDRSTGGKDANGSGAFIEERGVQGSKVARGTPIILGATCATCGAWRGELGSEPTPEMFIEHIVTIFSEVRRVLKDDGVLWLNLGDSYAGSGRGKGDVKTTNKGNPASRGCGSQLPAGYHERVRQGDGIGRAWTPPPPGMNNKNLLMIPSRVAMALQSDGWYLRSMAPWIKRNVMPESVNDRPTSACEYIFLLTKGETYYYDKNAVVIAASANSHARLSQDVENQIGTDRANGGAKTNGNFKAVCSKLPHDSTAARKLRASKETKSFPTGERNGIRGGKNEDSGLRRYEGFNERWDAKERKIAEAGSGVKNNDSMDAALAQQVLARNRRNSDWFMESWNGILADDEGDPLAFVVNPQPYKGAHFATWPVRLVMPMVLASSRTGDVVLDPFFGSGTTGKVALELGRRCIGIELNPDYIALAKQRCETTVGLPFDSLGS